VSVDWVIGVDPGLSGAVAILNAVGEVFDVYDMPSVDGNVSGRLLADLLPLPEKSWAIVEKVASMPKQGVASTFKFGRSAGVVDGVLAALEIPTEYVVPGKWKRDMGLSSDKEHSRLRAIQLWPRAASKFARKKDDGRAEACLLARWFIDRQAT
jgi:hypothetical protein